MRDEYYGHSGNGQSHFQPDGLSEMSTSELLKELARHTRDLVKDEARLLKLELEAERRELGDVAGEGRGYLNEGRTRARHDLDLARAGLHRSADQAKRAAVPLASGGVLLHAGIYLALFTLVFVLDTFLPLWAAGLIVTVVALAVGWGLLSYGRREVKEIENPFNRVTDQLKEDRRWIGRNAVSLKERAIETLRDAKSTLKESISRRSQES
jgi:hypothetical protein